MGATRVHFYSITSGGQMLHAFMVALNTFILIDWKLVEMEENGSPSDDMNNKKLYTHKLIVFVISSWSPHLFASSE